MTQSGKTRRDRKLMGNQRYYGTPRADVADFVDAGVSGFVQKGTSELDFLATIRSVARGLKVLPSQPSSVAVNKSASASPQRKAEAAFGIVRLTRRERDVFSLIASGLSRKEIAGKLHIAASTLDRHVQRIQRKISAHNRPRESNSHRRLSRKD